MSEVRALLEKAARSFDAAGRLLENGDADFAASRAYYGCFYVAEALLLDRGLSFSTHAGVIGEYGRIFARTRRLEPHFHRLLSRSFRARQAADYGTDFDLSATDVHALVGEGRRFLDAATRYLDREDVEEGQG